MCTLCFIVEQQLTAGITTKGGPGDATTADVRSSNNSIKPSQQVTLAVIHV